MRHKQALKRLVALEPEDPEARALAGQARAAIEAGDYDRAEDLLGQAKQRELAGIEAAELVPESKPEQRLEYRERSTRALYRQDYEKGDNAALNEAIRAYRNLLGEYPRDRVPLQWATTQNNLGSALLRLGERESGTARLEEAVVAFRAALREYTRERVPLQWAGTQVNLGSALARLGERESGTARLEDARGCLERAWRVYRDAGMGTVIYLLFIIKLLDTIVCALSY